MYKYLRLLVCGLLGASVLAGCTKAQGDFDGQAYRQEIMDWRDGRLERLLAPTGYLNQTGLYWLEEGSYRFGTGVDNDIVISGDGADVVGVFEVDEHGVWMETAAGVITRHAGESVDSIFIADDTTENPVIIDHRDLAWSVVQRDGRFGVRLRDYKHPFIATFGPLEYYDIDPSLRLVAKLKRYDQPVIADVGTVIEGLGYHPESPGLLEFEIDGKTFELEAYQSGDQLFFVFGDLTSRDDTYGAGRFVYTAEPDESDQTILDFNKSYSPPCAFNDFSTCPVASPRNRLPVRIEAGEKYSDNLHYSADD